MPWNAQLTLDYRTEQGRSVVRHAHEGPLRVLQSLYPEGDSICHNVLVHPPGGLVGGDVLNIDVQAHAGSHGLITTPGATRFYRSDGELAVQQVKLRVHDGARLEWLPLEALCYSGCLAENRLQFDLLPGGELMGWDVCALGLPHANQPFVQGRLLQQLEFPGVWLERGLIDAADARLLDGPLGLHGQRCLATLWWAAGHPIARARCDQALEIARHHALRSPLSATAGATRPQTRLVLLRVLAPLVEPALQLLRAVWADWRQELWGCIKQPPRIWST